MNVNNEREIRQKWGIWPLMKALCNASHPQANVAGALQFLKATSRHEDVGRGLEGGQPKAQVENIRKQDDQVIDAFENLRVRKFETTTTVRIAATTTQEPEPTPFSSGRGRGRGRGKQHNFKIRFGGVVLSAQTDVSEILDVVILMGIATSCGLANAMLRFHSKAVQWHGPMWA